MAAYALNESPNNGFATNMFSDCPVSVNGKMYSGSNNFLSVPETLISASSGTSTLGGTIKSGVVYSSTTVTDPLASLTQPAFSGGCTYTGYSYTASGGSVTLQPGNYCKGMTLGNSSNDGCGTCITTVTLNPGLYIVTGGANWQHVAMTGTGVTLFFTNGGGASYGQINIGNSSVINLSAPTSGSSGSIAGILLFLDRNWTNTSAQDFNFNSSAFGTSTPGSDGIWYLPSTGLQMYNAAWTCNNYCSLVADNFTSSNVTLVPSDNYSSISGGNPFRTLAVLVQ
jgi:hypothetical protein